MPGNSHAFQMRPYRVHPAQQILVELTALVFAGVLAAFFLGGIQPCPFNNFWTFAQDTSAIYVSELAASLD